MNEETQETECSSFRVGRIEVKYYVREPSPGTWNAVGVIYLDQAMMPTTNRCPMVVGLGSSSQEVVADLLARVLGGNYPDLPWTKRREDAAWISSSSETIQHVVSEAIERDSVRASR